MGVGAYRFDVGRIQRTNISLDHLEERPEIWLSAGGEISALSPNGAEESESDAEF